MTPSPGESDAAPAEVTLRVPGAEHAYRVLIAADLLEDAGRLIREVCPHDRAAIVCDSAIASVHGDRLRRSLMEQGGYRVDFVTIEAAETRKTLDVVQGLYARFLAAGLDRRSPIIAIGGGIVGDVVGFAAATFLRGVPFVNVPTTLLAMVDASVGGKTGVNVPIPAQLLPAAGPTGTPARGGAGGGPSAGGAGGGVRRTAAGLGYSTGDATGIFVVPGSPAAQREAEADAEAERAEGQAGHDSDKAAADASRGSRGGGGRGGAARRDRAGTPYDARDGMGGGGGAEAGETNLSVPAAMLDGWPGGRLGKNLVGAFHQPSIVLIDPVTLTTLPDRQLRAGLAECVKHAMIADSGLFRWIESQGGRLRRLEPAKLTDFIARNVRIKAEIVQQDARENHIRMLLNLGHTFAHAIESRTELNLLHGEAVALGLVSAAAAGRAMEMTTADVPDRVVQVLARLGLPTTVPGLPPNEELMAVMASDKKVHRQRIRLIVPISIGEAAIVDDAPAAAIIAGWEAIRRRPVRSVMAPATVEPVG